MCESNMKLILKKSSNIEFQNKEDLNKVIPEKLNGKVLNYGQGEGQVEIENTVWGFYVNKDGDYYMAYEEGVVGLKELTNIIGAIVNKINEEFKTKTNIMAEGLFTNRADV